QGVGRRQADNSPADDEYVRGIRHAVFIFAGAVLSFSRGAAPAVKWRREPTPTCSVPARMADRTLMDAHTQELLDFDKVRELLAGYAACTLGKELARQVEPAVEPERVRRELSLVSEMAEVLGEGHAPPFGGLHDVRLTVRRAAIGSMLT